MICGNQRSASWRDRFSTKSLIGSGLFSPGDGTAYPLGSLPLAQIHRYYWSARRWKLNANWTSVVVVTSGVSKITETTDHVLTMDFVPYLASYDPGAFGGLTTTQSPVYDPSNPTACPSFLQRVGLPIVLQGSFTDVTTITTLTQTPGYPDGTTTSTSASLLFVAIAERQSAPYVSGVIPPSVPGIVLDDSTPGNAYMSFFCGYDNPGNFPTDDPDVASIFSNPTILGASTPTGSSYLDTGIACSLDGITFKMFHVAPGTGTTVSFTGSIAIVTNDSDA